MRVLLTIAYLGTNYSGWQIQPGEVTIQSEMMRALESSGLEPVITAAGRTDAGVHARGQTAHIDVPEKWTPHKVQGALNACLPPDIRVMNATETAPDLHARFSAKTRVYRYTLTTGPCAPPHMYDRAWHLGPRARDWDAARELAGEFVGTHDFASFSRVKRSERPTERTVLRSELASVDDSTWVYEIEATGFLWGMVRKIVKALEDATLGRIDAESVRAALTSMSKANLRAAPAHGLTLWEVKY